MPNREPLQEGVNVKPTRRPSGLVKYTLVASVVPSNGLANWNLVPGGLVSRILAYLKKRQTHEIVFVRYFHYRCYFLRHFLNVGRPISGPRYPILARIREQNPNQRPDNGIGRIS